MARKLFLSSLLAVLMLGLLSASSGAAKKLKFGIAFKEAWQYVIPIVAGQERGFWKENGIELDWVAFRAGPEMIRAMAGGAIQMGFDGAASAVFGASRGIPIIMVSDLAKMDVYIWVSADSAIKTPKDLKGARIGALRFGGLIHAYGLMAGKKLGLEGQIKFVALGGGTEEMAAMKAGKLDGRIGSFNFMAPLKFKGEIRELVSISQFFPKEWLDSIVSAHRSFLEINPDLARGALRAVRQAVGLIVEDKPWTIEKMKREMGYSEPVARAIYEALEWSPDGRINPKAVENLTSFLVEFGVVPKENMPRPEELYTNRYGN